MSYATAVKENREPPSQQPHPDTALLNTEHTENVSLPDGASTKVNVAPPDFKDHPKVRFRQLVQVYNPPMSLIEYPIFMSLVIVCQLDSPPHNRPTKKFLLHKVA